MALRMFFLIDCIHWDSHIQWNFIPSLLEYLSKTLWARRSRLPQQGQSFTTPFTAETEISWFSELLGIFGIYFPFSHTRPALPEQLNPGAPHHETKTAEPPDEQCILTAASSDCIWLRNALGWVLKSGVITLSYQLDPTGLMMYDVWSCLTGVIEQIWYVNPSEIEETLTDSSSNLLNVKELQEMWSWVAKADSSSVPAPSPVDFGDAGQPRSWKLETAAPGRRFWHVFFKCVFNLFFPHIFVVHSRVLPPPPPPPPALPPTHNLSPHPHTHAQLTHTQLVHTQLAHTQLVNTQLTHTHNLLTHNLSTHNLLTHSLLTHNLLTHSLFTHNLLTHNLLTHNLLTHNLSTHNLLTHSLLTHNLLTHNLLTHNLLTHNLLTHNLLTHNLSTHNLLTHSLLTHNLLTHNLLTHNLLTHNLLTHNLLTHNLSTHNLLTHLAIMARGWLWWCAWVGRRGTWRHRPPLCVAGVALGDIDRHFVWQVWHLWHWAGSGGFCHTQLFNAQLCRTFLSHTTLSHISFTHNFVIHIQLFHTQLCPTQLFHTRNFVTRNSFSHNSFTHNFVTYTSFTHNLLHPTLSHTIRSHTTLLHTQTHTHTQHCHTQLLSCTISFLFPAFPISFSHLLGDYWKKLTCGVFRSFDVL